MTPTPAMASAKPTASSTTLSPTTPPESGNTGVTAVAGDSVGEGPGVTGVPGGDVGDGGVSRVGAGAGRVGPGAGRVASWAMETGV